MLIDLKTQAKQGKQQTIHVDIKERLPERVSPPCSLDCNYLVKEVDNYFVLFLEVKGELVIECQRCLKNFLYNYDNKTTVAICNSEACAERLMSIYECIVAKDFSINLVELITDELHLYSPESHPNISECDKEVSKFIHFMPLEDNK
ncbi:YceD family protein [Legionella sp. D16C41]|uniref:YceD family protein n=1 Tax=Legionella sp. D16C41 TaxID=3402688 RepID=UPI003AF5F4A9